MSEVSPWSAGPRVDSRDELIRLIFDLLDHNDAVEWPNDTAFTFLQAMAGWLDDTGGENEDVRNEISWQLFADALQAGAVYRQPPA